MPLLAAFADGGEGTTDVTPFVRQRALSVFSTTILPRFQAHG